MYVWSRWNFLVFWWIVSEGGKWRESVCPTEQKHQSLSIQVFCHHRASLLRAADGFSSPCRYAFPITALPSSSFVTHSCFSRILQKKKKIKHLTSHLFHVFLRVSCSRQRAAGGGAGGEREHAEPGEERHGPAAQRHATGSLQLDPLSAGLQRRHARPRRRWREAAGSRR